MTESSFEPSDRSQIHRLPSRGAYDKKTVFDILDRGLLAHVGLTSEHGPVVIPMAYARRDESVLLHGSAKSRILGELAKGTDACVTVTLIDGLVLARSTFHHSMNYRSVVVFGRSREITDPVAKNDALEHLVEHLVPGRGVDARGASPGELDATLVVEVPMTDASAKMRTGPPVDEKRDLAIDIWAGVVPLELTPGEPIADEHTSADRPVPDYVVGYEKGR